MLGAADMPIGCALIFCPASALAAPSRRKLLERPAARQPPRHASSRRGIAPCDRGDDSKL